MTRLSPDNISGVSHILSDYDLELQKKTGYTLKGLSLLASGLSESEFTLRSQNSLFCVVPITSGQGIISGFSETVLEIITFLGCRVQLASTPDISGFAEAFRARADFIFCADDNDFVSLITNPQSVVHNDQATAKGYVTALTLHARHKSGKILVLGCGPVGQAALTELLEADFRADVYDPDTARVEAWYRNLCPRKDLIQVLSSFPWKLDAYVGVLDATPALDTIDPRQVHQDLLIAAPGVPLGLSPDALRQLKDQVIHDPLQLGVAVMVSMSLTLNREP